MHGATQSTTEKPLCQERDHARKWATHRLAFPVAAANLRSCERCTHEYSAAGQAN